jgi:T5SS/PEP-CTERM-associated repeat protein
VANDVSIINSSLTMDVGRLTANGNFVVGTTSASGSLNLTNGAQLALSTSGKYLSLGESGYVGTVTVGTGSAIDSSQGAIYVAGLAGSYQGTLNLSAGSTVTTGTLGVGRTGGPLGTGLGTLNIASGATLTATASTLVGNSQARINLNGGLLRTGSLDLGTDISRLSWLATGDGVIELTSSAGVNNLGSVTVPAGPSANPGLVRLRGTGQINGSLTLNNNQTLLTPQTFTPTGSGITGNLTLAGSNVVNIGTGQMLLVGGATTIGTNARINLTDSTATLYTGLIDLGGVPLGGTSPRLNWTAGTLTLSNLADVQVGGAVTTNWLGNSIVMNSGMSLGVNGQRNLIVGAPGFTGTINQTGGTVAVTGRTTEGLTIGSGTGNGTYTLSAGALTSGGYVKIGDAAGSTARFTQSGGTVSTNTASMLGNSITALNGGTFTVAGTTSVGAGAQLQLNGGTLKTGSLDLGGAPSRLVWNSGVVELANSSIVVGETSNAANTFATSTLSLSGRGMRVTGTNNHIYVGSSTAGTITQVSDSVFSGGNLYLGLGGVGVTGQYNLTGGTLQVSNVIIVGQGNAGANRLVVTGGNVLADEIWLARFASPATAGVVDIQNATATVTNLRVGGNDAASGGVGDLNIRAGALVNVTGTTKLWNSFSSINLSDGVLRTGALDNSSAGAARFNWSGGRLELTGASSPNASIVVPATGTLVGNPAGTSIGGSLTVNNNQPIYVGAIPAGQESTNFRTTSVGGSLTLAGDNVVTIGNGQTLLIGGTLSLTGSGPQVTANGGKQVTLSAGGTLRVGSLDSTASKLGWASGSTLHLTASALAVQAGGPFGANLSLDGQRLVLNDFNIVVGNVGVATLVAQNGATIVGGRGLRLGDTSGGNGSATFTGKTTTATFANNLLVGGTSTGTLSVLDGATVTTAGRVDTNVAIGSIANITVQSTTPDQSSLETTALYLGGYLAGATPTDGGAAGTLTIGNAGKVTITGALQVLNNSSRINLNGGTLRVGSLNTGNVASRFYNNWTGGTLELTNETTEFTIGLTGPLNTASVALDVPGKNLKTTSYAYVGNGSVATVTVSGGANWTHVVGANPGGWIIANGTTYSGGVIVDGIGSSVSIVGTNDIRIGAYGAGTLTVRNGGSFVTTGTVGVGTNAQLGIGTGQGLIELQGTTSTITIGGDLNLAMLAGPTGQINVSAGTAVVAGKTSASFGGTLSLSGGTMRTGSLSLVNSSVLNWTGGTLEVDDSNAPIVASSGGAIGAVYTHTAGRTLVISDRSSTPTVTGRFVVGAGGTFNLSGGTVIARDYDLTAGTFVFNSGTAEVRGNGTNNGAITFNTTSFGSSGTSTLRASQGGTVAINTGESLYVGYGSTTTSATLEATGAGSSISGSQSSVWLGAHPSMQSTGTLSVQAGATASLGHIVMQVGTIDVSGTGSVLQTRAIDVGINSTGSADLSVSNGGSILVNGLLRRFGATTNNLTYRMRVGSNATLRADSVDFASPNWPFASVSFVDATSTFEVTGRAASNLATLQVPTGRAIIQGKAYGDVSVSGDGELNAGRAIGKLTLRPDAASGATHAGRLQFDAGSTLRTQVAGLSYDQVDVSYLSAAASSRIALSLANGVQPLPGSYPIAVFATNGGVAFNAVVQNDTGLAGLSLAWRMTGGQTPSAAGIVWLDIASTPGNANLDAIVDFDDLLIVAAHYGADAPQTWLTGDFTGDGAVNFDDLLVLAGHYGANATTGPGPAWAMAQATIPEPATFTALASFCLMLRRPRSGGNDKVDARPHAC